MMEERRSRLQALAKMGVVLNYADIHKKRVVVVGIGGVGSVAAEMLVRCGVGHLVVFDYDSVEMANMNRMFYKPSHIGLPKVDAAIATLREILTGDDEVDVSGHNVNITSIQGFMILRAEVSKADLTLCCVDNYAARVAINRVCLEENRPWIESGVSETAMNGHIQLMLPGATACFECAPPLAVASEESIRRDLVCTASLPTTMSIIAGLAVQAGLKFLLEFGNSQSLGCLSYEARTDYFSSYTIKPHRDCSSDACQIAQAAYVPSEVKELMISDAAAAPAEHASNEWGIEVVDVQAPPDGDPAPAIDNRHSDLSMGDLIQKLRNR